MALAYLPGVDHDIFISYCHSDDLSWISGFYDLLKPALRQRLGVDAKIWIDQKALDRSGDFRAEIPASLSQTAILLILASPSYVRSEFCVNEECGLFETQIPQKRTNYPAPEFSNDNFAFRLALLPVDDDEHHHLIPGLTDYKFHNGTSPLSRSSAAFKKEFDRLVDDIGKLMRRMRKHRTKVFLYPRDPSPGIHEAHTSLKAELLERGYSILPEALVNLEGRALESELGIFLLDDTQDPQMGRLIETFALRSQKPWLVWESPSAGVTKEAALLMLKAKVETDLTSPHRGRYFNASVSPARLKEQVIDLLHPETRFVRPAGKKRRVALICDPDVNEERARAYSINAHWSTEFDFDLPRDAEAASVNSDGVLLIWGKAQEGWAANQFERLDGVPTHKGLCVFDPDKRATVQQIRQKSHKDWHITEHYGQFTPSLLDPFFTRLRQSQSAGGRP